MANLDSVFRREWGPAVAALARWSGDLTVAEDAVQEAFAEALQAWPRDGVPNNPGGWVVTVARNRALDRLRRESVRPGKELAAVVDDIRARTEDMKSRRGMQLQRSNTGGSSGEPLVFYLDAERVGHDVAAKWRATRWFGVDIGDPEIVVWGSPIELGAQDRVRGLRDFVLRTALLPAFDMSQTRLDDYVRQIRKRRPRMLFGYPSALAHIARHAQARNVRLDDIGIKVAFVTSERLYDDQRTTIEQVFGCRVANGYGGRDAGFIAHECPEGRMHVTAEDIVTVDIASTLPAGSGAISVSMMRCARSSSTTNCRIAIRLSATGSDRSKVPRNSGDDRIASGERKLASR